MKLENEVAQRVSMLRFVMICGIVLLHTPMYVAIQDVGTGWFDLSKAFFQNAVFRSTVPMLTIMSGYFLFASNLDQRYGDLWRKKGRTIAIPFFFFNLSLLVFAFLAQKLANVTLSGNLLSYDPMTWLNAAFGLTASPINYPLNFLRDLLVILAISPVLGWLIRNAPLKGLVLVSLLFFYNFDGLLILRADMPVVFYVGGLAAVYQWNLKKLDRFAWPLLAVFLAVCCYVIAFRVANTNFLRLVAPFLIWPASALLIGTRAGAMFDRMSVYSFFIFVAHAPVLLLSWLVYKYVGAAIPYPVYWIAAPLLTIMLLIAVYKLAARRMPAIFGAILGSRMRVSDAGPLIARATPSAG